MARRFRQDEPGSWHHVVNRGIARRPLFEDRADIRFFLSRLAREVRRGRLEVHAWCVLTTHFHLLVRSPNGELSEAMRRAQNEYSRFFNRRHRRDGTLIRGRFLSKCVESLTYRRVLVRYIDANPIKAGLASESWNYPWCSAWAYVRGKGPPWLERTWIESEVTSVVGAARFRSEDYRRAFGAPPSDGSSRLVEDRLERNAIRDDLDDLIRAAPPRVQAWLKRKARLADRTSIGLPVCDPDSIRSTLRQAKEAKGTWEITPRSRPRDVWRLIEVGLLRSLSRLTWERIGRAVSLSGPACHEHYDLHLELLDDDPDYAATAARLTTSALRLCIGDTTPTRYASL